MKHPQSSPEVDWDAVRYDADAVDDHVECADDHLKTTPQNQGHVLEARINFLGWVKIQRAYVVNPGENVEVNLQTKVKFCCGARCCAIRMNTRRDWKMRATCGIIPTDMDGL